VDAPANPALWLQIFIGSVSGLSFNVVRTLARGVGIYPMHAPAPNTVCCNIDSDVDGGINRDLLARHWNEYRRAHERYLT
jgi:hypothetical protein